MFLTESNELRKVEIKNPLEFLKRQNEINAYFNKKIQEESDKSKKEKLEYLLDRYEKLGKKVKNKKATEEEVREYITIFNQLATRTRIKYALAAGFIAGLIVAVVPTAAPGVMIASNFAGPVANKMIKDKYGYQDKEAMKHFEKMNKYKYRFEENRALYESTLFLSDLLD